MIYLLLLLLFIEIESFPVNFQFVRRLSSLSDAMTNNPSGITWYKPDESNNFKLKDSQKNTMDLPIFPCDDYVALPTTEGNFHFIEMPCRIMMDDIYDKSNKFKPKFYGVVLQDPSLNKNIDEKLALYGTLLENTHRDIMTDGTQCCYNKCLQRFRVVSLLQTEPYLIAKVEYPINDIDITSCKLYDENIVVVLKTAIIPSDESSVITVYDLLILELEVWNNLIDVINLTYRYTNFKSTAVGNLSDRVLALAPISKLQKVTFTMPDSSQTISVQSDDNDATITTDDNHLDFTWNYIQQRLLMISEFSFAVTDIVAVSYEERQSWLQCLYVYDRLQYLNKSLNHSRVFLESVLQQGVVATIQVTPDGKGYIISKDSPNEFQ